MVDAKILGKDDNDKIEDFINVYDFYEAFQKPFIPMARL